MIKRLLCLLTLALVASCGQAAPQPPSDQRFGAPLPGTTRDLGVAANDPCRLLDRGAWSRLGFNPTGELRLLSTGERSCWWTAPSDDQFVSVIVSPARDVLVDAYRLRKFAILQPITIGGLPGTREQASADSFSCTVTVGTAVGQGLIATYDDQAAASGRHAVRACPQAEAVATEIVGSLAVPPGK
ncbi:DUF3558 family protein [Actinomycetospora sp. C-140]